MELGNEILELEEELKRLREKADDINLKIKNVLEELTCSGADEDADRQEFKLLFTKSIGKFIKISREELVRMGDDGNWEKAEEFYIGVVKEFRFDKYEYVAICDVVEINPDEVVVPSVSYIIKFEMLYGPDPTHKVEFITREEANRFILDNTPKLI